MLCVVKHRHAHDIGRSEANFQLVLSSHQGSWGLNSGVRLPQHSLFSAEPSHQPSIFCRLCFLMLFILVWELSYVYFLGIQIARVSTRLSKINTFISYPDDKTWDVSIAMTCLSSYFYNFGVFEGRVVCYFQTRSSYVAGLVSNP